MVAKLRLEELPPVIGRFGKMFITGGNEALQSPRCGENGVEVAGKVRCLLRLSSGDRDLAQDTDELGHVHAALAVPRFEVSARSALDPTDESNQHGDQVIEPTRPSA